MVLIVVLAYLCLLLLISRLVGKKGGNDAFFRANRRSPWWMVAFGMIGASISGVTFVSVPGMVMGMDMTYIQTCLGFIVGYFVVAFVLLPLYYKMNLTTIYTYLYNISNHLSQQFYGAKDLSAYELKGGDGPIMQCRHCIRYALGYCIKHGGKRPVWHEPLSLVLGDGRRFRLEFDCKNCQMNVYA